MLEDEVNKLKADTRAVDDLKLRLADKESNYISLRTHFDRLQAAHDEIEI